MKKSLRLQTEMRFINNRPTFTVAKLMNEFEISRSTAFRDLAEIQELGLPLTAQAGRNGGYTVLQNQTLPKVTFTPTELSALFTAFSATANQQLPFLKDRQSIMEKLLASVTADQKQALLALHQIVVFEHTNPHDPNLLELTDQAPAQLNQLISLAMVTRSLILTLTTHATVTIYFQRVYQQHQTWFLAGYDRQQRQRRLWPVTQIVTVTAAEPLRAAETTAIETALRRPPHRPNVQLRLHPQAIQRFRQYHEPGKSLVFRDPFQQEAQFDDYLDTSNVPATTDYADWLVALGPDLDVVRLPHRLRQTIQDRLAHWLP